MKRKSDRNGRTVDPVRSIIMKRKSQVIELQRLLSLDPYRASFQQLWTRVRSLNHNDRIHVLALVENALKRTSIVRLERNRVALAKTLVALVPLSSEVIRHWVHSTKGRYTSEVQFSLFCWLDSLQGRTAAHKFVKEVPGLVGEYLEKVRKNEAMASWMAGHLLGSHWRGREAGPVLLRTSKHAKFATGRKAALDGLEDLAKKAGKSKRKGY